jgi:hypothetical protein
MGLGLIFWILFYNFEYGIESHTQSQTQIDIVISLSYDNPLRTHDYAGMHPTCDRISKTIENFNMMQKKKLFLL